MSEWKWKNRADSRLRRALQSLLAVLLLLGGNALRAEQPLYEEEPYDQITLDAANNNAVLKILPLPNRQPPEKTPSGKLVIRLVESPDTEYEVLWRSIAKLELFEQLLLNKAAELVAAGKMEEAYDYYAYLERNKPQTPGLKEAVENFLYEEAKQAQRQGKIESALASLIELRARNPRRPGLDQALGRVTDELTSRCVQAGNYAAARTYLDNLAADFPGHPVAAQWRERLSGRAAPLLAEARREAEAGNFARASDLTRQAAEIWPSLPGARQWAEELHERFPRVAVGVRATAVAVMPDRLDDWATRRAARLLYRTLTEFVGAGVEGGKYVCPFGKIASESLGRRVAIRIHPRIGWSQGNAEMTNFDVSHALLALADPAAPGYRVDWADLMQSVSLRGVYDLDVELRRPHVRPEALLQIAVTPHGNHLERRAGEKGTTPLGERSMSQSPPLGNGPYVVQSQTAEATVYVANTRYFAAERGQPVELIERRYPPVAKAVAALRRGDVLAVDRLNPWELPALRNDPRLVVQPYAMPLVHCLVANPRRPLTADRTFRRALLYGIHRAAILKQMLAGAAVPGCTVTSSPFPLGIDPGDPMGYASDENIEPLPYEPRMTIALAGVALDNYLEGRKAESGEPVGGAAGPTAEKSSPEKSDGAVKAPAKRPKPVMPTLTLAFPASNEIASAACASIQKQLKLTGIPIELRPIEGLPPPRIPDDIDLMYVELTTWEPLVDARRVFGAEGPAGRCGPYMAQALRQLDEAADWPQARELLHRIHRIAAHDALGLPLWQLVDHFACHESLRGVAARPVSLYQNVEQWRASFQYPAEK